MSWQQWEHWTPLDFGIEIDGLHFVLTVPVLDAPGADAARALGRNWLDQITQSMVGRMNPATRFVIHRLNLPTQVKP